MKQPHYFALVGRNIEYSRSPEIFDAIYRHLRQQGRFEVLSMEAKELPSRVRQAVLDGCRGFSVTIPFKHEVVQYLDDIDPVALAINAVNSIAVEGGRLLGYNTDCYGFSKPLKQHRLLIKGGRAMILGCGGAARAAIYALRRDFDIKQFIIVARSPEKAEGLREVFDNGEPSPDITVKAAPLKRGSLPDQLNIVVNCTPVGGWRSPKESPLPDGFDFSRLKVYYDMNYNEGNRTVAEARKAGIKAFDGASMLVSQAVRSFDIWTGQSVEFEPIFEAVFGPGRTSAAQS